jgi:hypothetical protein
VTKSPLEKVKIMLKKQLLPHQASANFHFHNLEVDVLLFGGQLQSRQVALLCHHNGWCNQSINVGIKQAYW